MPQFQSQLHLFKNRTHQSNQQSSLHKIKNSTCCHGREEPRNLLQVGRCARHLHQAKDCRGKAISRGGALRRMHQANQTRTRRPTRLSTRPRIKRLSGFSSFSGPSRIRPEIITRKLRPLRVLGLGGLQTQVHQQSILRRLLQSPPHARLAKAPPRKRCLCPMDYSVPLET
jgi:hypothetical protein